VKTRRLQPQTFDDLVAECDVMRRVTRRARQAAASDLPVLLLGQPGSGRETLARAIHHASTRSSGPFVPVDCASCQGEALRRQLAGFVKDAFQGAVIPHEGLIARAHGGTLCLSELAALDLETQGILFRAMQEGEVTPLGSDRPVKVQVRLIAASSRDIEALARKGALREDLYYALTIASIRIPDLHERDTDVLLLADSFLLELRERYNKPDCTLTEEARKALHEFAWPGNLRQLRSALEHAVVFSQDPLLTLEDFPDEVLASRLKRHQDPLSPEIVQAALRRAQGNRSKAADLLGVGRTTLWRKIKEYGIQ
jgi:DNA-binding NtrC family response regulator